MTHLMQLYIRESTQTMPIDNTDIWLRSVYVWNGSKIDYVYICFISVLLKDSSEWPHWVHVMQEILHSNVYYKILCKIAAEKEK